MSPQAQGFFLGLILQGLPSLFSLFLTPSSVGNAEMTLGGIDSSKFEGSFVFFNLAVFGCILKILMQEI